MLRKIVDVWCIFDVGETYKSDLHTSSLAIVAIDFTRSRRGRENISLTSSVFQQKAQESRTACPYKSHKDEDFSHKRNLIYEIRADSLWCTSPSQMRNLELRGTNLFCNFASSRVVQNRRRNYSDWADAIFCSTGDERLPHSCCSLGLHHT